MNQQRKETIFRNVKRAPILILLGLPAYIVNLISVGIMVQYFDFRHIQFLTPVIIGDMVSTALNLLTYDSYIRLLKHWRLIK